LYMLLISLHCAYSFWGLRHQTLTGALPLDPAGGLPSTRPAALPLHLPASSILDKCLHSIMCPQPHPRRLFCDSVIVPW